MKSTHADRLVRWLGAQAVEDLSRSMVGWYGTPIALGGVPGEVYVCGDGDFVGEIRGGSEVGADERAREVMRKLWRRYCEVCRPRHGVLQVGGFASLAELKLAKRQTLYYQKTATVVPAGSYMDSWRVTGTPPAGATGGAAPGGTAFARSTSAGVALPFVDPLAGERTFVSKTRCTAGALSGAAPGSLLLYDRLFGVSKTMNSTATEAVTGVPTRYQSTTPSDPDYAGNNFLFMSCDVVLPATAHNWTVCQYTNQAGTTGQTFPPIAGISACAAQRLDMPLNTGWFTPLAAGDNGVKALTQMQCDALVASGAITFCLGHALAWLPTFAAGLLQEADGIKSSFNMQRVFDDAALSFLEQSATGSGLNWQATVELLQG